MSKVYKNIIVGAGFSSFVINNFLKNDTLVISSNSNFLKNYPKRKNLVKYLKIFSPKFYSRGKYKYNLKNSILHDTLILGGNTNLWGGICNIKKIKKKIKIFEDTISFKKLGINETGSFTNNKNLYQMQKLLSREGEIFNCSKHFQKIMPGHLISFKLLKKNLISLKIKEKKNKNLLCKNLILAINATQLIEVLINSNIIKDNDTILLTEHDFKTKISLFKKIVKENNNSVILGYSISGIIKHALGLQKNFNKFFFKLFNFIPFYYYQIFYKKRNSAKYVFQKEKSLIKEIKKNTNKGFGKSIHYYNLKINGANLIKKLNLSSKNIYGVSSPFLTNADPGPISNNLIELALKVAKKLTKK